MPVEKQPATRQPVTRRGRNTGLSAEVVRLQQENAKASRELGQWQQLHAQTALALAEVRRLLTAVPADELPGRLLALLNSPAATGGVEALRRDVVEQVAEDFVNARSLPLNRVALHAWILSRK
ncbi:hypothetical protein ACWGJ9_08690 [Curtobacterium citreum]